MDWHSTLSRKVALGRKKLCTSNRVKLDQQKHETRLSDNFLFIYILILCSLWNIFKRRWKVVWKKVSLHFFSLLELGLKGLENIFFLFQPGFFGSGFSKTTFSSFSIVFFEQVNVSRVVSLKVSKLQIKGVPGPPKTSRMES